MENKNYKPRLDDITGMKIDTSNPCEIVSEGRIVDVSYNLGIDVDYIRGENKQSAYDSKPSYRV